MIFDPFMFHPSTLLLIPAVILTIWAQAKVKSAYKKYAQVQTHNRITGAEAARQIMHTAGIGGLPVESVPGEMTDHYDPKAKVVRLSQGVYGSASIAALGIAAHEVGHAIQDAQGYAPMRLRHFMYPVSALGSRLAFPLIIGGLIFGASGGGFLLTLGIWLFSAAVAFTIVTLPVEFDASRRAVKALASGGYLSTEELAGVRKVLNAAALTYVAAAAVAVLQLVRLLLISRGRS